MPVLFLRSETRPDGSETKRKNRLTLSWQKGRGFQFVVFLPTNWNLLFRQTFFIFCVWLKTVRGQSPSLFLVKHKKIPRRVLILKLTFVCKASEEISFRSEDNVVEELNVKKITCLFYFICYLQIAFAWVGIS